MKIVDKLYYGIGIYAMGGSGGGGSSGEVDYPAHMKAFQEDMLNHDGADNITDSMVDVMNTMLGNSPFTGMVAYDPDSALSNSESSVDDFSTLVALLSAGTGLDSLISSVLDESRIDDSVTEFAADLDDRLNSEILPRFEGGMRDINAVVSSAFAVGKSIIESAQARQVAKYSADLHMKAFGDDAIRIIGLKLDYQKLLTHFTIESNRIKIVSKKEEVDAGFKIDSADAKWDIGVFQPSANMLASIAGSSGIVPSEGPSQTQSALGGAMSGAAMGAMVGGVPGAVVGGVLGAAASFI